MIASLIPLAFIALGLAGAILLFLSVKRELQRQARAHQAGIDQVLEKVREAEHASPPAPSLPVRPGLNIQKRVQALRLLRRGEDIAHIAAALCVPRREVELLIRVHELSAKRASGGT